MGFFDSMHCTVHCYLKRYVYYPGNVVEGFVELNVSSPINMVAIRVKATGKEKIVCRREEYDTDRHGHRTSRTRITRETVCVYKQLITLAGQMKCTGMRGEIMVPPGRYVYPFVFQLPVNIPPSFAKRAGNDEADILYHIKAYVDIPYGRDAVDRQWFTVVKPLPVQQWIARAPAEVNQAWHVTLCCCIDKGTVTGRIYMDRTLIAIDRDNLTVIAELDNTKGQEPIESLEITLWNHLTYRAQNISEDDRVNEGTNFINQVIPAGAKGRIAGTIPLRRNLVPTIITWNITSVYTIDIELNIPMATDPKHTFPVILAQSVDESNFSPPVTWNANPYTVIPKGVCPEIYYSPPPMACVAPHPIPVGPPPGAVYWTLQLPPQLMPLPPPGWGAPTVYQMQRPPGGRTSVQWTGGIPQPESSQYKAPPPSQLPPPATQPPPAEQQPPPTEQQPRAEQPPASDQPRATDPHYVPDSKSESEPVQTSK